MASYLYRRTELDVWTVGYYTPKAEWESESDHDSAEAAAQRVHWLNGGTSLSFERRAQSAVHTLADCNLNLDTRTAYVLRQILNRYLSDNPEGENAETARSLIAALRD